MTSWLFCRKEESVKNAVLYLASVVFVLLNAPLLLALGWIWECGSSVFRTRRSSELAKVPGSKHLFFLSETLSFKVDRYILIYDLTFFFTPASRTLGKNLFTPEYVIMDPSFGRRLISLARSRERAMWSSCWTRRSCTFPPPQPRSSSSTATLALHAK